MILDDVTAQAILAYRISQQFSKDQVLSFYLNEVYFGNLAYGAEAAIRARALTMREVAISSKARVIFFVAWTVRIRWR